MGSIHRDCFMNSLVYSMVLVPAIASTVRGNNDDSLKERRFPFPASVSFVAKLEGSHFPGAILIRYAKNITLGFCR